MSAANVAIALPSQRSSIRSAAMRMCRKAHAKASSKQCHRRIVWWEKFCARNHSKLVLLYDSVAVARRPSRPSIRSEKETVKTIGAFLLLSDRSVSRVE